jgi:hypothetical protein
MKMKTKKLLILLLAATLCLGLLPTGALGLSAEVKAETVDWPQVTKLDLGSSELNWVNVKENFTSVLKDYKITQYPEKVKRPPTSQWQKYDVYDIGEIVLYVDKLPAEEDYLDPNTKPSANFKPLNSEIKWEKDPSDFVDYFNGFSLLILNRDNVYSSSYNRFFADSSGSRYAYKLSLQKAETVDWPQVTKLDLGSSELNWVNVKENFTSVLKDYKITQYPEKVKRPPTSQWQKYDVYDIGEIVLYVDKLPAEEDYLDPNTKPSANFKPLNSEIKWEKDPSDFVDYFNGFSLLILNRDNVYSSSYNRFFADSSGSRYAYKLSLQKAETVDWPQVTKLNHLPTITKWWNVPEEGYDGKIVAYKIEQHDSLRATSTKLPGGGKRYEAGVITMYLDKLPIANEPGKTDVTTGIFFQYATPEDYVEIAWNGTTPHETTPEKFNSLKAVSQWKKAEWESIAAGHLYLQTEDGTKYYYRMAAEEYVEPGAGITLRQRFALRDSQSAATVKFSSNEAGTYYYMVSEQQLPTPTVDLTGNGTKMVKGTNTIQISGISNYAARYVYIVGKTDTETSAPLEIVVPGVPFDLHHEEQALEWIAVWVAGKLRSDYFYTEKFTNAAGHEITQAAPGDIVKVTFEANGLHKGEDTNTVGDKIISTLCEYQLQSWDINGVDISPPPTGTMFSFVMPENDVTVQAVVAAVGADIAVTTNMPSPRTINLEYKDKDGNWIWDGYDFPEGEMRKEYKRKSGLAVGLGHYDSSTYRPGAIWGNYVLEGVEVYNKGERLTSSEEELYGTGIVLAADDNYEFRFIFRAKKFAMVTAAADPAMGSATVAVGSGNASASEIAYEGDTVTLTAVPGERYVLKEWQVVAADGTAITLTADEGDVNKATFTMPATDKNITATAVFEVDPLKVSDKKVISAVTLYDAEGQFVAAGSKSGTDYTITLPAGADTTDLANMVLRLTYSEYATVTKAGDSEAKDWAAGQACGMALDTPATFTVKAEDGTEQAYTVTITVARSSDKDITAAALLNATGDTIPIAQGVINESAKTVTITLDQDTDSATLNSIGMKYLKLTHSVGATVAMAGGYSDADGTFKWANGDVMCNMELNTPVTFTVTAENGDEKEYAIEIKYDAPGAPELTNGSAERTSAKQATVKFTSSEAGTYYYAVVNKGAATPAVDTTRNGKSATAGENTITLNNLTAGAREIYIVVKNANGVESTALKVDIPAFGGDEQPGEFRISISAPRGGTLAASKSTASAGDVINVTATPDAGMQMVAGSLTYTLAVAGGETKKIDNFAFTMPAGDVSLTCRWETKTTTADGITSFSINNVLGSINSANGTISVVMPYGTDVTKLVPVISGSGITKITPNSGQVQDFSQPVTYKVTLADGTVKTYTVTVYVQPGTAADQMWDKLTDFYKQVPWWKHAEHQQSHGKYPRYW